ncbi:MAG: DUF3106 domain-containing protein, partial [Bryobacteraceae bacterium]
MNLRIHFRGAVTVTVFVVVAGQAHAQVIVSNLPPAPPLSQYQVLPSGVTLHELSPVVYFRGLLGMTPGERDRALVGKTPQYRKAVLEKVREYSGLPADVREARLRQTELRWDLIRLMKLPSDARQARLAEFSPADRAFLQNRLQDWDKVQPRNQATLVTNASFLDLYFRLQAASASQQQEILSNLPPARLQSWNAELTNWENLPEARRTELSDQFQQFFGLTGDEQKKTLDTFSDADRTAMERTLEKFVQLTPAQ